MVPDFNRRFVCIVDRKNPVLTGCILSYIQNRGQYTPIFSFPTTEVSKYEVGELDRYYIMVTRANEMSIRISNAISALKGCDYLILAGLNEHQKSYLNLSGSYEVIEIQDIDSVALSLTALCNKVDCLKCKEEDIFRGAFLAGQKNCMLEVDNNAGELPVSEKDKEGLIVIENDYDTDVLTAINYALSIDADITIINKPEITHNEIVDYLDQWKRSEDNKHFYDLSAKIYPSIETIDFTKYKFATFFTSGIPYSLILGNSIPFTYIPIDLHPDLFIFNGINFELSNKLYSSVVFSPVEFVDEETDSVIQLFKSKNYYVKELVGKEATSFNIDMHVSEFPYNLLHICSHGGEVGGYSVKVDFTDNAGNPHVIEYDEVISLSPESGNPLIKVTAKQFFRKLDGLVWRSRELKEKNYPIHVYEAMNRAMRDVKKDKKERKDIIPGSSAIKCVDFNYQAMFNSIAGGQSNPFVFNNTCWSNFQISHFFLAVGSRGYIGTLWAVNNQVAKNAAESFYSNVFNMPILEALQGALNETKGTKSENIYVFWGLHFSTIKEGISLEDSRMRITSQLIKASKYWQNRVKQVRSGKSRDKIVALAKWNHVQVLKHFKWEMMKLMFF